MDLANQADELSAGADVHLNRLCELVDKTLVQKAPGNLESVVWVNITCPLFNFVRERKLGLVLGPSGMFRLANGDVRMPDVSYYSKCRRHAPYDDISRVAPNLAVDILHSTNTTAEMDRKRTDYFASGVELLWIVDLPRRCVEVYSSPNTFVTKSFASALEGGSILPGFVLPIREIFRPIEAFPPEQ